VNPALPPRLRHRLADTILAALHDKRARRELVRLSSDERHARRWCAPDTAYGALVHRRAQQAADALRAISLRGARDLDETLEVAGVLFDAGLFFEVHEALEPHWREARGDTREALRGLIQIAVGYHHWAHGNPRGARALLEAGAARVRPRRLGDLALEDFGAAVAKSSRRVEVALPSAPPFPHRRRSLPRPRLGAAQSASERPWTSGV
jgi:hypothetical protein